MSCRYCLLNNKTITALAPLPKVNIEIPLFEDKYNNFDAALLKYYLWFQKNGLAGAQYFLNQKEALKEITNQMAFAQAIAAFGQPITDSAKQLLQSENLAQRNIAAEILSITLAPEDFLETILTAYVQRSKKTGLIQWQRLLLNSLLSLQKQKHPRFDDFLNDVFQTMSGNKVSESNLLLSFQKQVGLDLSSLKVSTTAREQVLAKLFADHKYDDFFRQISYLTPAEFQKIEKKYQDTFFASLEDSWIAYQVINAPADTRLNSADLTRLAAFIREDWQKLSPHSQNLFLQKINADDLLAAIGDYKVTHRGSWDNLFHLIIRGLPQKNMPREKTIQTLERLIDWEGEESKNKLRFAVATYFYQLGDCSDSFFKQIFPAIRGRAKYIRNHYNYSFYQSYFPDNLKFEGEGIKELFQKEYTFAKEKTEFSGKSYPLFFELAYRSDNKELIDKIWQDVLLEPPEIGQHFVAAAHFQQFKTEVVFNFACQLLDKPLPADPQAAKLTKTFCRQFLESFTYPAFAKQLSTEQKQKLQDVLLSQPVAQQETAHGRLYRKVLFNLPRNQVITRLAKKIIQKSPHEVSRAKAVSYLLPEKKNAI